MWTTRTLEEVSDIQSSGVWGDDPDGSAECIPVIRTSDIDPEGKILFNRLPLRKIQNKWRQRVVCRPGDIIVVKSSGSHTSVVTGKTAIYDKSDELVAFSNFLLRVRAKSDVILPEYLLYYLRSPEILFRVRQMVATTTYPNLKVSEYKSFPVRFPNTEKQQRIVARIKEMMERVDEIEGLSRDVPEELIELKRSLVLGRDCQRSSVLAELVDWVRDSETVESHREYTFAGIRSFGKGLFERGTVNSDNFAYKTLRRLKCGDFIFPKLMAWEGAFGMVSQKFEGMVVSPEFVVFRPKTSEICSEVLDTYFRSPACLEDVRNASSGSNRRRRRLNPQPFLALSVPVPSADEQRKLQAVYELESEAEEVWRARRRDIKAIRDSILCKAFTRVL